jgi:hypothetical protein
MKKAMWIAMILAIVAAVALAQATQQDSPKLKPSAARTTAQPPAHTTASPALPAPAEELAATPTTAATLPVGTTVRMKLETMLSTSTSKMNDEFAGRVTEDVVLNGKTVIPVGASLSGHVMRSEEPRRIHGAPVLDLRPETITMPNGDRFAINATVVDTSDPKSLHVDEEGRIKGNGHDSTDLVTGSLATGGGTLLGAMAGGPKGMLIGATIGGGAAVVRWMSRRHTETIPAGTELFMELSRPMSMSMSGAAGR